VAGARDELRRPNETLRRVLIQKGFEVVSSAEFGECYDKATPIRE